MIFLRRRTITLGFFCLFVALGGLAFGTLGRGKGSSARSAQFSSQVALKWPSEYLSVPGADTPSLKAHNNIKDALRKGSSSFLDNIKRYINDNIDDEAVRNGLAGKNYDHEAQKVLRVRSLVKMTLGLTFSGLGGLFLLTYSLRGSSMKRDVLSDFFAFLFCVCPGVACFYTNFFSDVYEPSYLVMAIVSKNIDKEQKVKICAALIDLMNDKGVTIVDAPTRAIFVSEHHREYLRVADEIDEQSQEQCDRGVLYGHYYYERKMHSIFWRYLVPSIGGLRTYEGTPLALACKEAKENAGMVKIVNKLGSTKSMDEEKTFFYEDGFAGLGSLQELQKEGEEAIDNAKKEVLKNILWQEVPGSTGFWIFTMLGKFE